MHCIYKKGKKGILFFAFYLLSYHLAAQDSILMSYERSFVKADSMGKVRVLRDAALDERSEEFMGRLCGFALNYALWNGEIMKDDPDMINLINVASKGAAEFGDKDSSETLWDLFSVYEDVLARVEILNALGDLGKGNAKIVDNLNQFLANQNAANQNAVFSSDMAVNYPVIQAAVAAIGKIGDASSYLVLFSTLSLSYPEEILQTANASLNEIPGDFKQFLLDVVQTNPATESAALPSEKLIAFRLGMESKKLTDFDKGELAQAALEAGFDDTRSNIDDLRYQSAQVLTDLKWVRASDIAVKRFYRVQTDYVNASATKTQFIDTINLLGAMGTADAAKTLALQLGLINSKVEQKIPHDEDIVIAFVRALGEIGDKLAFDDLLRIRDYLDYSEKVKTAANASLSKLKW
ncbi:MAG: hypothetical protein LBE74_00165 [Treponema sp.]|jgi:hypothetical protein|nr:hypothetical protein [Treponema sp.]